YPVGTTHLGSILNRWYHCATARVARERAASYDAGRMALMPQDTRKDPRAKVLSMTVRYKSATIDEFIEHHSHHVSRGGIFIKTPSPFPPGTLLKFEIRIQEEQSVLAGVGRVVWKREPPQASPEAPAGMGVKFIKIDDKSKALISRLVENQQGKVSTFD